jgi:hypothetical protein
MTDNYQFLKSKLPQGVEDETPFVSSQFQYINDINNGVYSNNGLTLVQWDLSSLYNSSLMICPSTMYMAIPITIVSAYVTNAALIAPASDGWASVGMKMGYWQILHSCDLTLSNKTLEQSVPYTNVYVTAKMLSQASQDDLKNLFPTLGAGDVLDNYESMVYNGSMTSASAGTFPAMTAVTGGIGGNGLINNLPFGTDYGDQNATGQQYVGSYNNGYYSRLKRIIDASANNLQKIYGPSTSTAATVINNVLNFQKEFKPYYSIMATYYQVVFDVAIIRMCDILDSMKQMPMMRKFDGMFRAYFNTGTVVTNLATGGYQITSSSGISFTNTCPLICTQQNTVPAAATGLVAGLFIGSTVTATALSVQNQTINLANSGAGHFMNSCRMYYQQVQLRPELALSYIEENRAKKVCFTKIYQNIFNGITTGSTFNYLIQGGVKAPRGVWIMPYLSGSTNGATAGGVGITNFSQLLSPFDTCIIGSPVSLINVNVQVGGMNVLNTFSSYGYEEFLQQVSVYEKLNSLDIGMSTGLFSQNWWEQNRAIYVDCSRGYKSDQNSGRNINIQGTNNSLQTCDLLIFVEYFDQIQINVESGQFIEL